VGAIMDMIFETAIYINDWATENIFIVIPALTFLWTMYVYKKNNNGAENSAQKANKIIYLLNSEEDPDYKMIRIQEQTLRYVAEIVDHVRLISAILMSIMVFLFLYALK
jgi:hypothetical protein